MERMDWFRGERRLRSDVRDDRRRNARVEAGTAPSIVTLPTNVCMDSICTSRELRRVNVQMYKNLGLGMLLRHKQKGRERTVGVVWVGDGEGRNEKSVISTEEVPRDKITRTLVSRGTTWKTSQFMDSCKTYLASIIINVFALGSTHENEVAMKYKHMVHT